ncbi:MAG TPA: hypothetical protein PLC99_13485 [Verrucomicrobiota bacterium]|nr:hypothetical protein [Verrucomicrobiota bacterium]
MNNEAKEAAKNEITEERVQLMRQQEENLLIEKHKNALKRLECDSTGDPLRNSILDEKNDLLQIKKHYTDWRRGVTLFFFTASFGVTGYIIKDATDVQQACYGVLLGFLLYGVGTAYYFRHRKTSEAAEQNLLVIDRILGFSGRKDVTEKQKSVWDIIKLRLLIGFVFILYLLLTIIMVIKLWSKMF